MTPGPSARACPCGCVIWPSGQVGRPERAPPCDADHAEDRKRMADVEDNLPNPAFHGARRSGRRAG